MTKAIQNCASIAGLCAMCILLWSCGEAGEKPGVKEAANVHQTVVSKRPNFLIIVADDLGYSDLGAYGGEINTPNLDRLSKEGLLFTNFYVAGTCAPTRAMLLTGVDHHRAGLGNMVEHIAPNQRNQPGYEGYLNERVVTMSERLQDAGYRTYMAGKWHVGSSENSSPAARGFDRSFVLVRGGANHFDNTGLNGKQHPAPYREDGVKTSLPEDFSYSTDFYTDKLIQYLDESKDSDEPFFAYLTYTAPHWPLQAPPENIAKYEGVYDAGWKVIQEARLNRMKKLGLVSMEATAPEIVTKYPAWGELSDHTRQVEARRMEIFAAMVDRLDRKVGELIAFLKETGQYDNTVILFMSDNGNEGAALQNLPIFADWIPRFDNSLDNMGEADSYVMIEERWAQVSMTPHRLFKGMPSDGGIRVPAFITYGGFKNQGARHDGVLHVMDIAPTLLSLAGLEPSVTTYEGREVYPVQGLSMLAALNDPAGSVRGEDDGLGWELFNKKAYRKGKWKVVHMHQPWGPDAWQLFDLSVDPGEANDLADVHPEILDTLVGEWDAYAEVNGVILGDKPPER
ncbi:MAG: arylsulfatase [Pseudomonadota bacterium]